MFVNAGLEYSEILKFIKKYENIEIIKTEIDFREMYFSYVKN